MSKKKYFEKVTIDDFAAEGKCIYKSEEGVVFVEGNVAPGDVVDLEVIGRKKRFMHAVVRSFHSYSPMRAAPYCEHVDICGGCKWQHITYDEQIKFKERQVTDQMQRIAGIKDVPVNQIVGADKLLYYRNKLEFTFSDYRWLTAEEINQGNELSRNGLGFHVPKRFDKVFTVNHCHLQEEPSNKIRNAVHAFAGELGLSYYDLRKNIGFLRNIIIRTANSGDIMVILQVAEHDEENIRVMMDFIQRTFPEVTSLYYIVNTKGNDSYQDQEAIHFAGDTTIREKMEDFTFLVGPKSFYQTNSDQAYKLYSIVREYAALTGNELVYDLYTGTGTIANFVARQAKWVTGLEYVEEAVKDAVVNSKVNNISNTNFLAGDMRYLLNDDFVAKNGRPDVIITDPPRAGMDQPVVETILKAAPDRIVYVSCNPATQARDLLWMESMYRVEKIQPVDMFPHTHHVENVVLLKKR